MSQHSISPKVSIIIPVYNASKFIQECLENCTGQTMRDIEIIVIDDKSTDNTVEIINDAILKDSRIKLIKLDQNYKQGYARNIGIENSNAEYIMFLDADDKFSPDCVEKMYNKITQDNAEITVCKFFLVENNIDITDKNEDFCTNFASFPEKFHSGYNYKDMEDKIDLFNRRNVVWDKIYKKKFLIENNIKFPKGMFCEDDVFTFRAIFRANKITILNEKLVYYTIRENSSSKLKDETTFDCFKMYKYLREDLIKLGLFIKLQNEYMRFETYSILHFYDIINKKYKRKFFKRMYEELYQFKYYADTKSNKQADLRTYIILNTILRGNSFTFAVNCYFRKLFNKPF